MQDPELPEKVVVWSEGCRRTRRNTSAGIMTFGQHCVKRYSHTRGTNSLSSGESQLLCARLGLEAEGLLNDVEIPAEVQVNIDSITARNTRSSYEEE